MPGKFEVFTDKKGETRFHLKAPNGEIILASEGYRARQSALKGIASVKNNASNDARFQRNRAKSGYWFNLRAGNNRVIGTSETYKTKQARDKGIVAVKRNAPKVGIDHLTK